MKKATIAGVAMIAALFGIIYLFQQSAANAQPPSTTRVVTASPQGEWVVVGNGPGANMVAGTFTERAYIVMVHTGTGKTRMVHWRTDVYNDTANVGPDFKVYDTP